MSSPPANLPRDYWDARFLNGTALSQNEWEWLAMGADIFGVEHGDETAPEQLWAKLRAAMDGPPRPQKNRRRTPAPHPWEREAIADARETTRARRIPAAVKVLQTDDEYRRFAARPSHGDARGWWYQLHAAFATRSPGVVRVLLAHLLALAKGTGLNASAEVITDRMNAALAIIEGANPENELQAQLVVQMVGIAWINMDQTERAMKSPGATVYVTLASRLGRTFAHLAEALAKLQGKSVRQHITVVRSDTKEAHVHHHYGDGGSTVFRSQADGPTRGRGNFAADPVPALEHAECAALPSQDEGRGVLPGPSEQGQAPMPQARGRERLGRTSGRG